MTEESKKAFNVEKDPFTPHEDKKNDVRYRLAGLLQHTANELKKLSETIPELGISNDESIDNYIRTVQDGKALHFDDDLYNDLADREDVDFQQMIEHAGKRIGIGKAGSVKSSDGVLSGEKALIKATEALGLGTMVRIPLYRSGIWITLKAPSDDKLSEMERRISQNKVNLGRDTYGNIFSNSMVYTVKEVIDLILSQVYQVNVKVNTNRKLLSLIRVTDLHMLVQGFLCSIYPKGYDYSQACTSDVASCNHLEHGRINLTKMIWTDRSMMDDKQLDFMVNPSKHHTVAEVEEYQSSFSVAKRNYVQISDIKIFFREPSLEEFIDTGYEWIDSIVKSAERVFSTDTNQASRNNYIYEQAVVRQLGKWAHWVGEIEILDDDDLSDGESLFIKDRNSINKTITNTLSSMTDERNKFTKAVLDFISDSTITVVGIPRYTCPSCGKEPTVHDKYKEIIPINPITVFFMLLDQKLSMIAETE